MLQQSSNVCDDVYLELLNQSFEMCAAISAQTVQSSVATNIVR